MQLYIVNKLFVYVTNKSLATKKLKNCARKQKWLQVGKVIWVCLKINKNITTQNSMICFNLLL